jgi:Ca2+-transporting ATPase
MAARQGKAQASSIIAEMPFSSARRMASVLVQGGRVYVRGAPEVLLERSTRVWKNDSSVALSAEERHTMSEAGARWAAQSMRVIALAFREGVATQPGPEWETELTFLGLVGIVDPPRPEVAAAIAEARSAGIRTMMITGDHPATARAIAEEIRLWQEGDVLITGNELDSLDQQSLESKIDRVAVVARATAEHKLRIVSALKARKFICAMTGDGVNDAPAVKAASIGVAMGRAGADVTKESAALVLSDDNYATIVAAVEEGRAIYANIRKFIFFLLSSNAGAVLFVLAASLFGWELPLAPIQILWINLITNGLPALALGVDGRDPEQMNQPPRDPGGAILSQREYVHMLAVGATMAATALYTFVRAVSDPLHADTMQELQHARAMVFALLSIGPLIYAFSCRSEKRSIFALGLFSNRALWGAFAIGLTLQLITIYVPPLRPIFQTQALSLRDLAWVFLMALIPSILVESWKMILRRRRA